MDASNTYRKYIQDYQEGVDQLKKSQFWGELEKYITGYLHTPPTIEELWKILDKVWEDMQVDATSKLSLANYYSHPLWLYNGLMMESDTACVKERYEVACLARKYHPQSTLDVGGGTGALLKIAHEELPMAEKLDLVDISSRLKGYVLERLQPFKRVRVLDQPEPPYDVVFSTEVMEHLPNPFKAISSINKWLKPGGIFIGTWSFYPMVKAHLPNNFCLARFFHRLIPLFGFRLLETSRNGSFIFAFEKIRDLGPIHANILQKVIISGRPLFRFLDHCIP